MHFSLDAEQQQFQESAARFFRDKAGFERWRASCEAGVPFDRALWSDMAEFGWLALNLPEDCGGFSAEPVYTNLLMEQAGRALSREPLVGSCVIAAKLIPHLAEPLRGELADAIMAGKAVVALAHGESQARFDLADVRVRAQEAGKGYTLHGQKSHVPDGAAADWFIVPARSSGEARDRDGISLFLVPASSRGLTRHGVRSADHRHHARLQLDATPVDTNALIGKPGQGLELLEMAVDHAIVAGLAQAVGIMEALRDETLAYLKTRKQFGVPIGSFQVLQHRMVDMEIACEEARAMLWQASSHLLSPSAQRRRAVSAAKVRVGQTSLFVGHQAVQLHGGIGTTDELIVSHYLKRLLMLESSFGHADFHRRRFIDADAELAAA
ncbi:MAG: acyl-CoA dehydrogenase family protein [Rhodoferax sp.]|nr:acyl-CoA dehydrogenase family protein [Rhodoferax sp.]